MELTKVKLIKISVLKVGLLFLFSGLIFGLISAIFNFIFIQAILTAFEIKLPMAGSLIFSFLIIPIFLAISSGIFGLITGLIFNLCLKIIHGFDMFYLEE